MIVFIIGLFVGCFIGVFWMVLFNAISESDKKVKKLDKENSDKCKKK